MSDNVIRLASSRERAAVRACSTCAHRYIKYGSAQCGAVEMLCSSARLYECNEGGMWEPKPPRMSAARRFWLRLFGDGGVEDKG
jgi:hypothetical protein